MSVVSLVPKSVKSILSIDALLYLVGVAGLYLISLKADLPFISEYTTSGIIVKDSSGTTDHSLKGLTVVKINEYVPSSPEETETYLDGFRAGEKVKLTLNDKSTTEVTLSNYYSKIYIFLTWLIGSSFFAIAIIVLIKAKTQKPARLFHWVSVFTALFMMITWGYINIEPKPLGYILRGVLHLSVSLVPALFLHFTLAFPREKKLSQQYSLTIIYILSSMLFILLSYFLSRLHSESTASAIKSYVFAYNISRIYLILCSVAAIIIFIHSYKTAPSDSDKKRLKWILYGLSVGPLSFILLWTLPIILTQKSVVPEEVVLILISVIPITFAISIVKYRIMDVDQLINRSVVYALVIGFLLAIYLLVITMFTNFAVQVEPRISAIVTALFIALLFQPVRDKVQKFVDKKFFRVQYNFREALKNIFTEMHVSNDIKSLAVRLVEGIGDLIPVEKIGLFTLNPVNSKLKLLAHKNFDLLENHSVIFEREKLTNNLNLPTALTDAIEPGVNFEAADSEVFNRWGMNLVLTLKSGDGEIHGFFVLGSKKSGDKFAVEDIDLLNAVVGRAAASIDRINLQEQLVMERIESERLDELSRIKSYFISSVSHDMKTPLTSIKMFAELLQTASEIKSEKSKEYLKIIEGESSRLSRLIDNVLDFSRIERGIKKYQFENIDLNEIVDQTIKMMCYQFSLGKFDIEINLIDNNEFIFADKDAVEEALINLLSNSIKYSKDEKKIVISTNLQDKYFVISVEDKGIGISSIDLENIFNPFFRIDSLEVQRTGGAGLGLSIVKHIMEAHQGKIDLKSEPGKGSRFMLCFPRKIK